MNILRNSYILGLLMIIVEIVVNNILLSINLSHTSGFVWSILAGIIYAAYHKEIMPRNERLKALFVYLFIAGIIGVVILLTSAEASTLGVLSILAAGTFILLAVFMYLGLKFGSWLYMRSYQKKLTK